MPDSSAVRTSLETMTTPPRREGPAEAGDASGGPLHGLRVLDLEHLAVDPLRDRRGGIVRATLAPVLQGDEGEGRIRDVSVGPDGYPYLLLNDMKAEIYRLRP